MRNRFAFLTSETAFFIAFTIIFASAIFLLQANHEMWHDETCEWLIAKTNASYSDLIHNYSTMRHPLGWISCLWILTKFTSNMFSMQALNLFLVTLAIYIFLRFAPFSKLFKVLFVFGYFPLYEYGVISREYGLGMLLLFIFAVLYQRRHKFFILSSFIIAILANVSFVTFFFTGIIFIFLIFDSIIFIKNSGYHKKAIFNIAAGFIVIMIGLGLAYLALNPMDRSKNLEGVFTSNAHLGIKVAPLEILLNNQESLLRKIYLLFYILNRIFYYAFLPIPLPFLQFWGTNLFSTLFYFICPYLRFYLSYPTPSPILVSVLFLLIAVVFKKSKPYLMLWASILSGFFVLSTALQHRFTPRHYGFLYLYFISCLWLAHPGIDCKTLKFFKTEWLNELGKIFILLILICQVIGAGVAVYYDWKYPFTRAPELADYILKNHLEKRTIVGWRDDFMPSIIAYAGLNEVYYPQAGRLGAFVVFDEDRLKPTNFKELLSPVVKLGKKPEDLLFIITLELLEATQISDWEKIDIIIGSSNHRFRIMHIFYPAIVPGESFVLLELQKQAVKNKDYRLNEPSQSSLPITPQTY